VRRTNKYLAAFAYLLAGSFLMTASWRAGLGLLLTSGWAGVGPDFILFLGINLIGLYLSLVSLLFYYKEAGRWLKKLFKRRR
jgi:hypothetical protein